MTVPVVDISGLYSQDVSEQQAVCKEIADAIHQIGFLYIKGHQIPESTINGIKSAARDFFAQDLDEKMQYYMAKSSAARGYVPEGEEIFESDRPADRKEAMSFGKELPDSHPYVQQGIPFYGHNLWPASIPNFKERVVTYFTSVYELAHTLLHAFAMILGLDYDVLAKHFQDPLVTMRLLHYPFRPDLELAQGIGEHDDFECMTILLCDAPGLELKIGEDEWLDVPPIPDTFVVNIGDMFEIMSNGRMKPKRHRVRPVKEERYSFPFFFGGNYFGEMKPLPGLASPGDQKTSNDNAVMGDHVWSAYLQTFRSLTERVRSGELKIPDGTKRRGIFAESARQEGPEA